MKAIHLIAILVLLLSFSILLCGCGSTTVVGHKYPAVPVGSVQVLYQEPKRPYEVIAFVGRLSGVEHISADIAGLQKEAAQVGGRCGDRHVSEGYDNVGVCKGERESHQVD
jgi:hypothetical protein